MRLFRSGIALVTTRGDAVRIKGGAHRRPRRRVPHRLMLFMLAALLGVVFSAVVNRGGETPVVEYGRGAPPVVAPVPVGPDVGAPHFEMRPKPDILAFSGPETGDNEAFTPDSVADSGRPVTKRSASAEPRVVPPVPVPPVPEPESPPVAVPPVLESPPAVDPPVDPGPPVGTPDPVAPSDVPDVPEPVDQPDSGGESAGIDPVESPIPVESVVDES